VERTSLRWLTRVGPIVPPIAVIAAGVWTISPRFSITGPSLIDDWDALISAPAAMHALVHWDYHLGQRFFPTWILWNWIQWRLPGAPGNMLGPNIAGVVRLAMLAAGITALTWIVVHGVRARPIDRALLCTAPALIVLTVPGFARDLARFGPEEPALVGGMALGAATLYLGGRTLSSTPTTRPVLGWCLVAVGLVVWCYGVFQKETSVCVLVVLAAVAPHARAVAARLSRGQRRMAMVLSALALLPIVGMLYAVILIVRRGTLVYGAHVQSGSGVISTFREALDQMHPAMQSYVGFVLISTALIALLVSAWGRRFDWTQLALILGALASLVMSTESGAFESRYYLPTTALLAIGTARGAGSLPTWPLRLLLAATLVFAVASAISAHSLVDRWSTEDQHGDDLVAATRQSTHDGCRLRIEGVDYERTRSIATLVTYPNGHGSCTGVARQVLIGPSAGRSAAQICAPARATPLGEWVAGEEITLVRCG
jgi:hypothetical protein